MSFDVFQKDNEGVLWLGGAASLEEAKTRIPPAVPGEYIILDRFAAKQILVRVEAGGRLEVEPNSGQE